MTEYDFTDPLDDSRWRLARDGNGLAFLSLASPGVTQPRHIFDRLADEAFRLAAENSALRTACGMLQKDEVSSEAAARLLEWCREALLQSEPTIGKK